MQGEFAQMLSSSWEKISAGFGMPVKSCTIFIKEYTGNGKIEKLGFDEVGWISVALCH